MQDIINKLNKTAGVRGTAVVGEGGLIISASIADNEDPSILGAVVSGLHTDLSKALQKLDKGELSRYILSGEDGHAVIMSISEDVLAVILLRKDVNMGMVLVELKDFAAEVAGKIKL
ncbi:MAG: roadblock/LC7 domain-containing protein [Planctomycetota bacterium]|jgi:predicted regulator of Ras-like GTPase activity (Roadblock/LC7/MglB family)